jgi:hypothetical protein
MKTYTRIGGIVGLLAAGVVAWALFRPELLWINSRVDERAPEAVSSASATGREVTAHRLIPRGAGDVPAPLYL